MILEEQIGERIKNYRKNKMGLTQKDFAAQYQTNYGYMEVSILSHIERGKIKGSNTSYLTNAQINDFSEMMNCSIKELIFGSENERVNLVKLILLGIIMNGSKSYRDRSVLNPIIDINEWEYDLPEFLRLALINITNIELQRKVSSAYLHLENDNKTLENQDIIKESINWYKNSYGFFADTKNYKYMNIILSYPNKNLEKASNLLINLQFGDTDFATDFITGAQSLSEMKKKQIDFINKFRKYEGQYGDIAIDWKEVGYYKFIKAFNHMWARNSTRLMDYFDEALFNNVSSDSSFKDFNESFFENIIISSHFNDLLFTLLNDEKYNLETMVGHNIVSTTLQNMVIKSKTTTEERFQEGYNAYKCYYDIHQITQALIDCKESEVHGNLYLFINELNTNRK